MEEAKIIATGIGRRRVEPTIAAVRLKVEDRQSTAANVQESVSEKCTQLVEFLRYDEGVNKVETTGLYLVPRKEPKGNRISAPTGYIANKCITFEIVAERSEEIISGALRNGATAVSGVSFKASEPVRQQARLDAVKDGVKKATAEAYAAAQAAGIHINKVVVISIGDRNTGTEASSSGVPLQANKMPALSSEQIITAQVTVTFRAK